MTPHVTYVEEDSMAGFYKQQVDNLERWSAGEPLLNLLSSGSTDSDCLNKSSPAPGHG